jgi:monoamine oxidase|tara:strand:+ start:11630 stop:12877 length:1248 start_codon:yes stop_codon:yes gene_type:complete
VKLPSANPDVVIVGAGTSGLSAAKKLKKNGFSVVVLEAKAFVGGRCITDKSTFRTPFDIGGSWLHSAVINPLARLAEENGISLHKKSWDWTWVYSNGTLLTPQQVKEYGKYHTSMWLAANQAGAETLDQSVEKTLPQSPWKKLVKNLIAPMLSADPDVTSSADVYQYADAEGDWLLDGGLGTFIRNLHSDVNVVVNCPVSKVNYSGKGVKIETPIGSINAKYVILTVSTSVLAAEHIKFTPQLPKWKLEAINLLPTGVLNKIGLEFDPGWQEAHQGESVNYLVGESDFCTINFGFYDTNLAVGFVAGRFAEQLEKEGVGAATNFCIEGVKAVFGNNVTKYIQKTTETAWKGNLHTLGSYSYALPGAKDARLKLSATLGNRLFFAGEATMLNAQATVHGAYLSGIRAAEEITAINN